jgi:shikimate dehydrogenase
MVNSMEINGKTRTCGLLGNPVEHTLSPLIHNTLAEKMGIDLVYVPFLVEEELAAAVKGAYRLNVLGLNVTVPHKTGVIEALKDCDEAARRMGAVNTLVRTEGGYKGYNTDLDGLGRALASEGVRLQGEKVIILGAGGAARAAAFLCGREKAGKVYMLNRNLAKAEEIAALVNEYCGYDCITPMALADYHRLPEEKMLCIQATSVGLAPHDRDVLIEDEAFYRRIHTGFDVIYKPADTRFMQMVRAQGGEACHGLKMLLYQGIQAFELWNGIKVSEELTGEVYEKMKGELGIEE